VVVYRFHFIPCMVNGESDRGEGSAEDVKAQIGYIPSGLEKIADFWKHATVQDYGIAGYDQTFWQQALGYLLSAFVGVLLIGLITYVIGCFVSKKDKLKVDCHLANPVCWISWAGSDIPPLSPR